MGTGFEPAYTALQAVASPLGHPTEEASVHRWPRRADDGTRTRDPHLGKVMRYQLRYVRIAVPSGGATGVALPSVERGDGLLSGLSPAFPGDG